MSRALQGARLLAFGLSLEPGMAPAYDWLQFNGDPAHSGNNALETTIAPGNVASLAQRFQASIPSADGAPVVLQAVATPSGTRDLLFVTTKAGHIIALDAQTGTQVWSQQYGAGACRINNGGSICYTTSSPAIDPNRLYVYSYGLDGFVHKYQVGDGVEIMAGGWPQLATTKGFDEKGSSALATATSQGVTYLYVTHGGYPGDNGDYQGHVTAINLASGAQRVFNAMCSDQSVHFAHTPGSPSCARTRSAIWARPGIVYDAGTDRIFMATGNGSFDANQGGNNWSETIFALHPDGSGANGKPLDSYTPSNFQSLDNADADLGSAAPVILPVPASSRIQHLAMQTGKDGRLRLVDLTNLSGQGGPGHIAGEIGALGDAPQDGDVLPQPAVWINPADGATWVFVANGPGLAGYRLAIDTQGTPSLIEQWQSAQGGSSPLIANGVLYVARSNLLRAMDPLTGNVLWSTAQIGSVHWESPVVANGMLYITDEGGHLTAFAPPASNTKIMVVEFYASSLDHYFITPLAPEISALDAGTIPGWARTGQSFQAYSGAATGASPVCRFYLPPAYGDSHFYSASPAECTAVQARYPFFELESSALFYILLPDPNTGACPAASSPVYRAWDDRVDTNHRYTTSRATRDQMVAAGWVAEGYGPDLVIMCSPN
jgi:outer membrane protein assembly factor BamB